QEPAYDYLACIFSIEINKATIITILLMPTNSKLDEILFLSRPVSQLEERLVLRTHFVTILLLPIGSLDLLTLKGELPSNSSL
uniref:hypothetical protein n=1 Tax=Alteromonas stellipolaris TaxID=233316 RepID=UPI003561FC02